MLSNPTLDFLQDLPSSKMNTATNLDLIEYIPATGSASDWDNADIFFTTEDNAISKSIFSFNGQSGATYDIFSASFFDPFALLLYDDNGNVIATDNNDLVDSFGEDTISDFVAPYTGTYYVDASWNQGLANGHKFVSLSVYEDIDTIPEAEPTPTPTSEILESDIDRIFNWGESTYSSLLPDHKESIDVFGYYARIYENGNAIGEQDGNIYFYDGGSDGDNSITLVGASSDLVLQATAGGF